MMGCALLVLLFHCCPYIYISVRSTQHDKLAVYKPEMVLD